MEISEIPSLFGQLSGFDVSDIEPINRGRNSQVFKIKSGLSGEYVLKLYSHDSSDTRDRVGVEYKGLTFLWNQGIKCIPKPIAVNYDLKVAIYEFINGYYFEPSSICAGDIDEALDFLISVRETQVHEDALLIPWASEACFSVSDLLNNINIRLKNLEMSSASGPELDALRYYLKEEFKPFLNLVTQSYESTVINSWLMLRHLPPCEEFVLSPSDFGFHNAIKRGGETVFVDFEYFGWDDPAKTLSDFLLHPAMQLASSNRERFAKRFLLEFNNTGDLNGRFKVFYPFYGLKWCLILLNEFMPSNLEKRRLVGALSGEKADMLTVQLLKSKDMLDRVKREYEHFPY